MMKSIMSIGFQITVLGMLLGYVLPVQAASPSLSQMWRMEAQVRSVLAEQNPHEAAAVFASQFGMSEFARRCLVDYWADLDAMQQQQYVFLFSKLLTETLESRLERISTAHPDYRHKFLHMRRNDDGTWTARARLESPNYTGTVDYVFSDSKGRLELVDYVLDGVSLSRNYRGRFNNIMRNRGYAGLLADLNAKLERVAVLQPR